MMKPIVDRYFDVAVEEYSSTHETHLPSLSFSLHFYSKFMCTYVCIHEIIQQNKDIGNNKKIQ